MAKYDKEVLQAMAIRLLKAKREGDVRYVEFLATMHFITGIDPHHIEEAISDWADANFGRFHD